MRSSAPARIGSAAALDAILLRRAIVLAAALTTVTFGQTPAPAAAPAPQFAGSESCQPCHDEISTAFKKNLHAVVDTAKRFKWEGKACESCHGPGQPHAESADPALILNPRKLTGAASDASCLACHRNQPSRTAHIQSSHAQGQVTCSGCHTVHAVTKPASRAASINQQCSACHLTAAAQFQRPHAHRLPQGAIACTDCHNPHGTRNAAALRNFAGAENGCFNCHADKRGPFTFEHAPMRMEGCGSCHEPHGSANPRMLTRHEVRFVCLECHAGTAVNRSTAGLGSVPPSFHDLRSPRYRNCTICHTRVHGSHADRNFLR